ncbi:uncharacterized protein F5147DRAFT_746938 [Suillus discolor]|uniref:C2H2-type domain-containing protein n=1 Tax=Suillus discolor TaxID=1912936 RepID=A0A9P7F2V9_9AGAM|nr:uncharacterized protein F5147DRAFT_746938 [Suillus discolor]KAG2101879.1 hypothetical protein F5147DRAFT_746938 [Suillus discolor]
MAPGTIRLVCQAPGCNHIFKNKSGLTKHNHTKHLVLPQINRTVLGPGFISPRARSPTPARENDDHFHHGAEDEQENPGFVPKEGTWVDMGHLFCVFHPHLTGLKCDADGAFIEQDTPPLPHMDAPPTDWTPYQNRVEFKTAEFLFTQNQMSTKQIDTLLDLWAATLIRHNDAPPFANHKDMYAAIDATPLGDVPWKSSMMCYNGIKLQQILTLMGKSNFRPTDLIAQNLETHGSTFVPLIMGSDKIIILVATGHTEYHPLYLSIGNIFNSVRRAHRNGVVLVGFLAIPKSTREHNGCSHYRNFWQQLFQRSLAIFFESVKMCLADPKDLDSGQPCLHRREEHTELLVDQLTCKQLWFKYGIIGDLIPFTNDFPHADIHELLSPDLLHQIIEGTFKDHLVDWVEEYLTITHGAHHAAEIMDDIDRRIAAVYIPAIKDHVPEDITCAFSVCLDFCYLVRHEALTEDDFLQVQEALDRFHQYREIFKTSGATKSFSLPCQHSMCHYILMIRLFGAPNGLCSSITESKHIKAVKEPWHRSSRFKAVGQMLLTNQCLDKIAAAHADFEARCVLDVNTLGLQLNLRHFPAMIQEFLHNQLHLMDPNPAPFNPATAPIFLGKVTLFNSAAAIFYAPSDLSDTGGMRREHIRSTPSWRGGAARHDCIFVNLDADMDSPMGGLVVVWYRTSYFPCAVVHWYSHILERCDLDTGMHIVTPATTDNGTPDISIIHIDCIFHAAHLIPVYRANFIARGTNPHDSYNDFDSLSRTF